MIRKLFAGWFQPPNVGALEGFLARLMFAVLLVFTLRAQVTFTSEPHQVGLLKLLHGLGEGPWLTWLADPEAWAVFKGGFIALLFAYVAGAGLPVVLPVLAVMHVLPFTLYNSQGFTHHGNQIVSCALVLQACAAAYAAARQGTAAFRPPGAALRAWMLVQAQVAVAGMYFISVWTKLANSGGMWLWNSNHIALDMVKTQRQSYLNHFDPAYAATPPEALWMLAHPWVSRLFFSSGVVLELVCILAIGRRRLAFAIGVALIAVHRSIDWLMGGVAFLNNELLCFIFLVNLPFLMAWPLERLPQRAARLAVAGGLAGVVASYWLQPEALRAALHLGGYLLSLVNSIGVWNSLDGGEWARFFRFVAPVAAAVTSGVVLGAAAGWLACGRGRGMDSQRTAGS
jgi:hypothetical protein